MGGSPEDQSNFRFWGARFPEPSWPARIGFSVPRRGFMARDPLESPSKKSGFHVDFIGEFDGISMGIVWDFYGI